MTLAAPPKTADDTVGLSSEGTIEQLVQRLATRAVQVNAGIY